MAHVQVMEELTKYLQCCNINAMIDILNIRDIASQVSDRPNDVVTDESIRLKSRVVAGPRDLVQYGVPGS